MNIDVVLDTHKLTKSDYKKIKKLLNRDPNILEIGIFSAMWSEHCSYKSSKMYIKNFPTEAPWVIQGPGENAGIIDIGDNLCAVFKVESHNHPSYIEPHSGAATGVGGIVRDIFTMGARPVAILDFLRFGDVFSGKDSSYQKYLLKNVVAGIGWYGNCMGIPNIGGDTSFDKSYNKNILVNAFSLGLCKKENIFYSKLSGRENLILYIGKKTGRDGLHGAIMASDSFSDEALASKSTVQLGDPFAQKLLLEACLELFKNDYIVGIQDMGAAGLTSSSFEMASKGNCGIALELDKVPLREANMTPYEIMLSESQERMLVCAKKESLKDILSIFKKWEVDAFVVGKVIKEKEAQLYYNGSLEARIPISAVVDDVLELNRQIKKPLYIEKLKDIDINKIKKNSNKDIFRKIFFSIDVVDKGWIYSQYDSTVQTNTIKPPGSLGASSIRVKGTNKAISIKCSSNQRYSYIDPKIGGACAVVYGARSTVLAGAIPKGITNCLNYGNPEDPSVMWQFKQSCDGITDACNMLKIPVVSGNVSLYNETDKHSIYPTPTIVVVGLSCKADMLIPSYFQKEKNAVYVVGQTFSDFGGSLYLKEVFNRVDGKLPKIDYKKELSLWRLVYDSNRFNIIDSAKNIGIGGIAVALAKMSAVSGLGVNANLELEDNINIFSESFSRAILEVNSCDKFEELAKDIGIEVFKIGHIIKDVFILNDIRENISYLSDRYYKEFENYIKGV